MLSNLEELDEFLAEPSDALIDFMRQLEGDLVILGVSGKMGPTLARRAVNAVRRAGVNKRVIGVARFSDPVVQAKLQAWGVEAVTCDLNDAEAVRQLPQVPNVVFMAGRKFGTQGSEDLTWAMNALLPWNVAEHYRHSRIVAFSTGCVYPLRTIEEGGCVETDASAPVGEYSQSCLARERVFQYAARQFGTKIVLFRLNYAIDLRYGVLHDVAAQIRDGKPVCDTVGYFNVIWQGDANDYALRSLAFADNPPTVLNATGPETASIRQVAVALAQQLNLPFRFTDTFRDAAYLSNAGRLFDLMGYPSVPLDRMIRWQAEWLRSGGATLGKPTHFETNDGKF